MKTPTKEQWLKARTKGIGSSDVAAVLGISPFKTNKVSDHLRYYTF
ncbi:MAG TPA: YqaJ viral recombinase family protein [Planctomycetota bacterium]|nr:YqaJ viral recombinase family protein [Planctomycetota bacterium]HQB01611.1 YqaJ viral recombinase family protein [Planctomycetota bacterium]